MLASPSCGGGRGHPMAQLWGCGSLSRGTSPGRPGPSIPCIPRMSRLREEAQPAPNPPSPAPAQPHLSTADLSFLCVLPGASPALRCSSSPFPPARRLCWFKSPLGKIFLGNTFFTSSWMGPWRCTRAGVCVAGALSGGLCEPREGRAGKEGGST